MQIVRTFNLWVRIRHQSEKTNHAQFSMYVSVVPQIKAGGSALGQMLNGLGASSLEAVFGHSRADPRHANSVVGAIGT